MYGSMFILHSLRSSFSGTQQTITHKASHSRKRMRAPAAARRLCLLTTPFVLLGPISRAAGFAAVRPSATSYSRGIISSSFSTKVGPSPVRGKSSHGLSMSAEAGSYPKGVKPLDGEGNSRPKLWIYDHCPYCVRPR